MGPKECALSWKSCAKLEVEGTPVFFVASVELSFDQAHIGLLAIWAG